MTLSDIISNSLSKRHLYLWDDITAPKAKFLVMQLKFLADLSNKDIFLFISSDGGDIDAALSIIDEITTLQSDIIIHTVAYKACSAAADILALGTKNCRWIYPNATIMLHPPSFELEMDNLGKQESYLEYQKRRDEDLSRLVAKACGKSYTKFTKDVASTMWLDAKGAIKYGVADHLVENMSNWQPATEF